MDPLLPPSPDIWQYVDHLATRRAYEAVEQERNRQREWRKLWQPWAVVFLSIVAAACAWTGWHVLKIKAEDDLLTVLRTDYPEKGISLQKAIDDLKASREAADEIIRNNRALQKDLSDSKQIYADTQAAYVKSQQAFDDAKNGIEENFKKNDALAKENARKLAEQVSVTVAGLKDTISATAAFVPDDIWKELAMPVGTVLYVRPSTVEKITGHDEEWWKNRKNFRVWNDNTLFWVPFQPGARYVDSQLDKLEHRDEMLNEAKHLAEALQSFSSAKGVLLIRINGPLP